MLSLYNSFIIFSTHNPIHWHIVLTAYLCLSVWTSLCVSIYLLVGLSIYLYIFLPVLVGVCLFIYLCLLVSVCICINSCLSASLSVWQCLGIFIFCLVSVSLYIYLFRFKTLKVFEFLDFPHFYHVSCDKSSRSFVKYSSIS